MGIDYVVDLACGAKEALSTEGIVGLVKARSRAEAVLAMARDGGDQRPVAEITFEVAVMRDGNITSQQVSVQSLLDQAAALEPHRGGCTTCPANRDNPRGYGCYNSISYPLEPDTERMLLSHLPADLESPAGSMFADAMEEFGWDGEQATDMRAQGDTFFRLREAPVRRWPSGLTITGDQLFHMMFHLGTIGSSHAMMLGIFLGLVQLGDDADEDADEDDDGGETVEAESGNAHQMIEFVNTLVFAASQELDILVDG